MFLQKRNVVPFFWNPGSCRFRGIPGIPAGMHNLGCVLSLKPLVGWEFQHEHLNIKKWSLSAMEPLLYLIVACPIKISKTFSYLVGWYI
jgi:hypothetical protein